MAEFRGRVSESEAWGACKTHGIATTGRTVLTPGPALNLAVGKLLTTQANLTTQREPEPWKTC